MVRDFSLGAYPALYILLSTEIAPGEVRVTDYGGDWWQRYTWVGVPREFPKVEGADDLIMRSTVAALSAIRPDCAEDIASADRVVRREANSLRFLIKSRETKAHLLEISSTIGVWRQSLSLLHISVTDKASGQFMDAEPVPLTVYSEAFSLAGQVKVDTRRVLVEPNSSIGARLASERHGGALERSIVDFVPRPRPEFSKLVRL